MLYWDGVFWFMNLFTLYPYSVTVLSSEETKKEPIREYIFAKVGKKYCNGRCVLNIVFSI